MRVFICYRRDDTIAVAGRIFDHLEARFGIGQVIMDLQTVPRASDFPSYVRTAIGGADVVIALIGSAWRGIKPDGTTRISSSDDHVRAELEFALTNGKPILPILVGTTSMPTRAELPPSLHALASVNAARLDPGLDFRTHVDRIIADIQTLRALHKQVIDGDWTGTLIGRGNDLAYRFTIVSQGVSFTGTAFGKDRNNAERWVAFEMVGRINGDVVTFTQLRIIDGNPKDDWCLIEGELRIVQDRHILTLTGNWWSRSVNTLAGCSHIRGELTLHKSY